MDFSTAQVQGQRGTEGHGEKPGKAVCNGFSVSTVERGAPGGQPGVEHGVSLMDLAVNYSCAVSV